MVFISTLSSFTWFLLACCLVSAFWYLYKQPWNRLPPGPPSVPVLGSIPFLPREANILKVFSKLATQYGDIFTVYLGLERTVVLNGYQAIKAALVDKANAFAGRPQNSIFQDLRHGKGIIFAEGALWDEQRRYTLRVLMDFGFGKSSMEDVIMDEIHRLLPILKLNIDVPCNPQDILPKVFMNIISTIVFAQSWDYDDEKQVKMITIQANATKIVGVSNPLTIFPFLKYLPGNLFHYKEYISFGNTLDKYFQELIAERKLQLKENDEPFDFVGVYLQEIEKHKDNPKSHYTEHQLVLLLEDLYAAGTETSSTTMAWCLLYLANNSDIQEQVHGEVLDVMGVENISTMDDVNKMPYTQAVISETQRLGDISPFGLPHTTLEYVTIHGYDIPKGTSIMTNVHSVHMDPHLWPDPHVFDPKRFLNADGSYRKREELIPFSLGKRACPGKSLANMEMSLLLTTLVKNFHINLPKDVKRLSEEGVVGIVHHPKDFHIVFELRNSENI